MINKKSKFLSTKRSFSLKVFLVIDRAFNSPQQMWSEPALPNVEVGGTILIAIKFLLTELVIALFTVEDLVLETIVAIGVFRFVVDSHAHGAMWTE